MKDNYDKELKIPLETFLKMQFEDIKKSIDKLTDQISGVSACKADKSELDKVKSTQRMLLIAYAIAYGALTILMLFKDRIFS